MIPYPEMRRTDAPSQVHTSRDGTLLYDLGFNPRRDKRTSQRVERGSKRVHVHVHLFSLSGVVATHMMGPRTIASASARAGNGRIPPVHR